ncbi:MAG: ELM1/GtrOC1 family putative glycosyltransferase, partial [Pseudomonadota bacterium]
EKGKRLGELTNRLATTCGGSVLASDSPRTPVAAADAVEQALLRPHYRYRWQQGGQNPYRGLLALADAFVVTGESMSMLAEAAAMARPLFIFDMGDSDLAWWRLAHSYRYKPLSHRLAMTLGPQRMRRDIGRIQMRMVADRDAHWLDEAGVEVAAKQLKLPIDRTQGDEPTSSVDLHRAADAVRRLLAERSMGVQVPAAE